MLPRVVHVVPVSYDQGDYTLHFFFSIPGEKPKTDPYRLKKKFSTRVIDLDYLPLDLCREYLVVCHLWVNFYRAVEFQISGKLCYLGSNILWVRCRLPILMSLCIEFNIVFRKLLAWQWICFRCPTVWM